MVERRKVFRIEEIAAGQRKTPADETVAASGYAEIMQELRALRALIAPSRSPSPTDRSASPLSGSRRLLRWSTTSCAERSTNALSPAVGRR
jgi:hypothetical protein